MGPIGENYAKGQWVSILQDRSEPWMCSCAFWIVQVGVSLWNHLTKSLKAKADVPLLWAKGFDVSQNPQGKARLCVIIAIKWESHHVGEMAVSMRLTSYRGQWA